MGLTSEDAALLGLLVRHHLLLPDVEEGNVRLIGATTHNPGFYVNPPLLSRSP